MQYEFNFYNIVNKEVASSIFKFDIFICTFDLHIRSFFAYIFSREIASCPLSSVHFEFL